MSERLEKIVNADLYDENMIQAINTHALPVVAYPMNVCRFTETELNNLDMRVKQVLRSKKFHGIKCSDERLYLPRDLGGRGLISLRHVYAATKIRIACYMCLSSDQHIQVAWERETSKEFCSIMHDAANAMKSVGYDLSFGTNTITLDGEDLVGNWKTVWKKIKTVHKQGTIKGMIENYGRKEWQSLVWKGLDKSSHTWLKSWLDPHKTASIIEMQEQMVETRQWKQARGLAVESGLCRICGSYNESLEHLLAGCTPLAGTDYLQRHNKALLVFTVAWAKECGLLPKDCKWYKVVMEPNQVLENDRFKLTWDMTQHARKTTQSRRPDLIIEDKLKKIKWIVDMKCPMENNKDKAFQEKVSKYSQLAFEFRERQPGYMVYISPLVIGCFGGVHSQLLEKIKAVFPEHFDCKAVVRDMVKIVVMESESIKRKIFSGLI